MKILKEYPPNYNDIVHAFPVVSEKKGVLFAWGDTVYNPSGKPIPEELMKHEQLHSDRQTEIGVSQWWDKYLTETKFRFDEELLAHRVEYNTYVKLHRDLNQRAVYLHQMSLRLSGELYGKMCTYKEAADMIRYY